MRVTRKVMLDQLCQTALWLNQAVVSCSILDVDDTLPVRFQTVLRSLNLLDSEVPIWFIRKDVPPKGKRVPFSLGIYIPKNRETRWLIGGATTKEIYKILVAFFNAQWVEGVYDNP